jgi:dolichol-phosphate mannosyltransferase
MDILKKIGVSMVSYSLVRRLVKFGIVGVCGIFVNQGLLFFFTEFLHLDYRISSIIAIECAIISNFIFNSRWTWKDRHVDTRIEYLKQFGKYNLSSGVTAFMLNWVVLVVLTEVVRIPYLVSNLAGIATASLANFTISHVWTFSTIKPADTSPIPPK